MPRAHVGGQSHLHRFVPGSGDLEEDLVLPLQADLPVIQTPGREHGAIETKKVLGLQPLRQRSSLQCPLLGPRGALTTMFE